MTFDRPHWRQAIHWNTADLTRPSASCQHHDIGTLLAPSGDDAPNSPSGQVQGLNRAMFADGDAGCPDGGRERSNERAVFDLMVARAQDSCGYARPEMRFALPRRSAG